MARSSPKEESPIRQNFHTHTTRCKHATGSDESYVLAAIEGGYSHLGFSEHTPWPYPEGFVSSARMDVGELAGYVQSVRRLQAQYAGRIEISLGLEVEHWPEYRNWLEETVQRHQVAYLIYGNHYDDSRENVYYGKISSARHVRDYARLTVEAIRSGLYACLAHPDLYLQAYPSFDDSCRKAAIDICQAARAMDLPLEYNISGFYNIRRRYGGLGYPWFDFWEIAAREGCSAIIGLDAHEPGRFLDTPVYDLARQHLQALGMREVTHIGR